MDVDALGRSVTAGLRVDAASCGSHNEAGRAISTPASCGLLWWKSGQWQACFFAALRAAGIAQHRRHPAAYRLCAMDRSGAGHPCPAPFKSGTLTPSRGCDWRTHPLD